MFAEHVPLGNILVSSKKTMSLPCLIQNKFKTLNLKSYSDISTEQAPPDQVRCVSLMALIVIGSFLC